MSVFLAYVLGFFTIPGLVILYALRRTYKAAKSVVDRRYSGWSWHRRLPLLLRQWRYEMVMSAQRGRLPL